MTNTGFALFGAALLLLVGWLSCGTVGCTFDACRDCPVTVEAPCLEIVAPIFGEEAGISTCPAPADGGKDARR